MYSGNRPIILSVLFAIVASFVIIGWICFSISDSAAVVENFEECVAIGNPIMETQPRRCRSAENEFAEVSNDEITGVTLSLK